MISTIVIWLETIAGILLASTIISNITVVFFVTLPLQRAMRLKNQDMISDMVVWPFKSFSYMAAVVIPFIRWETEQNRWYVQGMDRIRQAATPLQWWLCLWFMISVCGFFLIALLSVFWR